MGHKFVQYGEQLEDGTVREIARVPVGDGSQHIPAAKRAEYQDAVERGVNVSRVIEEDDPVPPQPVAAFAGVEPPAESTPGVGGSGDGEDGDARRRRKPSGDR